MRPALRNHWPAAVLIAVVIVGAVLRLAFGAGSTARAIGAFLLQWVAFGAVVSSYAYRHFEPVHVAANRALFSLTNPEGIWGITADIVVLDGRTALKEAFEIVDSQVEGTRNSLAQEELRRAWSLNGLTIVVGLERIPDPTVTGDPLDAENELLRIDIPDLRRPFRSWQKTIDREAVPILEAIEKAVLPYAAEDRTYVARVGFPAGNPYFGLFVSRIEPSAVTRVRIDYSETIGKDTVSVTIRKDGITLVTRSLQSARALSLQYLGLVTSPR